MSDGSAPPPPPPPRPPPRPPPAAAAATPGTSCCSSCACSQPARRPLPLRPMRKLPRYGIHAQLMVLPPPASRSLPSPSSPSSSSSNGRGSAHATGVSLRLLGLPAHVRRWYASRAPTEAAEPDGAGANSVFRRLLGKPAAPEPWFVRWAPRLSWEDRVLGFLACLVIAWALTASSIFSYHLLLMGEPGPFATRYTLGNVLAIASSSFLVGPQQQVRQMLDPVRRTATVFYLGSIGATLVSALILRITELVLACICLQFCAMLWYGLSYIPYGKQLVSRVCRWLLSRR